MPRVKESNQCKIPKLQGFLSNHESDEKVVDISMEPSSIYFEEARDSLTLNFDPIRTPSDEYR